MQCLFTKQTKKLNLEVKMPCLSIFKLKFEKTLVMIETSSLECVKMWSFVQK